MKSRSNRRSPGPFLGAFLALLLLGGLLIAALPQTASAAVGPWAENDHGRLRLISAGDTAAGSGGENDGKLLFGVEFELQPDWKIYWRSPGDAGFPPSFDWTGSRNLAQVSLEWPAPHRFSLFGLETFGYGDAVIFPLLVEPQSAGQGLDLQAKVTYLTCNEICVPYDEVVSLTLPPGPAKAAAEGILIEHFRAMVPGDGKNQGLRLETAVLEGEIAAPVLVASLAADEPFAAPDLLVEGPPGFYYAKPQMRLEEAGRRVVFRMAVTGSDPESVLEGKPLTLTLLDGLRGMEARVMARYADDPAAEALLMATAGSARSGGGGSGELNPVSLAGLLSVLGLALLGGMILNLMPCVLPVLSIKLLSVAEQGGRAKRDIRASFIASSAGILVSFWVLAAAAIAVKQAGMAVGWGIQFQQPVFLLFMAFLVTLFAYNLLGFFELPLPAWLGTRLAGGGGEKGLGGAFGAGAFATLLATPCSAPFLGTAVGFALARGPAEILAIFTALGLGLAAPYLLIALLPGLARRLPRPGVWMIWLRRILGLALAATAVWLLSVLEAQIGLVPVLVGALLLLLLGLALWGRGRLPRGRPQTVAGPALALGLALAVLTVPLLLPASAGSAARPAAEAAWPALDRGQIAALVAEGKVVFVDVTADWCITCKVNKSVVLEDARVAAALQDGGTALQRGDWTSPDSAISDYLASFARYGIPFNAVYGPGLPNGAALPELLTVETVLQALEKARNGE